MELKGTDVTRKGLESERESFFMSSVSVCVFMVSFVSSAKQLLIVCVIHFGS